MKFLKFFLLTTLSAIVIYSCSKTDSTVSNSKGTLKINDTTGDCLAHVLYGTYTAGVALTDDNYIDVEVNVTSVGAFDVLTDSVNGMYFSSIKGQRFGLTGLNHVHLYGHGKPLLPGLTTLTIQYNGSSCTVSLIVQGTAPGSFLLIDTSGNNISSTSVNGAYIAGTPLVNSDSVVLKMNVTRKGLLYISSDTVNGFYFAGATVCSGTGIQSITLSGKGIPQLSGTYNFTVIDSLSDTCKFSISVSPYGGTASVAAFKLGGTPGSCSGFTEFGDYVAGVKLNAADSLTTVVNVTRPGTYSVVTNSVNGVSFSSTGKFDTAGIYVITLRGFGTPSAPGTFNYTAQSDSSSCTFSITYAQGLAQFTLGGATGACSGAILTGDFKADSALTLNNTVTLAVNVITPGNYTITTNLVDGIQFSASGIFSTTGLQNITLTGTGMPTLPGLYNYVVEAGSGNCIFSINIQSSVGIYTLGAGPYGNCSGFISYGTYTKGQPVTTADSVATQVNVTYTGPYSIKSDSVNADGLKFSASGVFTQTGPQKLILHASGTPTTSGNFNIYIGVPPNDCYLSIRVQ